MDAILKEKFKEEENSEEKKIQILHDLQKTRSYLLNRREKELSFRRQGYLKDAVEDTNREWSFTQGYRPAVKAELPKIKRNQKCLKPILRPPILLLNLNNIKRIKKF